MDTNSTDGLSLAHGPSNSLEVSEGAVSRTRKVPYVPDPSLRALVSSNPPRCLACSRTDLSHESGGNTHHEPMILELSASRCHMCRFLLRSVRGLPSDEGDSNRFTNLTADLEKSILHYEIPQASGGRRISFELFSRKGSEVSMWNL